ncbi:MAG TPA: tetratricopeptide repeat protein [bacterium]|nr:tetratricopeptide repeat protein [bacterium]HXB98112.1 tetratricopeptide repeat protein [bacterium]
MSSTGWIRGLVILAAAGLGLAAAGLPAEALDKPAGLAVDAGAEIRFTWAKVDDAGLYRVAVFDAPDGEGKRLLLAAVWVSGTAWAYGEAPSVPSAGHLPSTRPLSLTAGHKIRVMVAAARADGTDKSDWSGVDFKVPGSAARSAAPATPSPTASPSPAVDTAKDLSPSSDAELELGGGDEFKTSPDPAVIDVQDGAKADGAAGLSPSAGSDAAAATAATGSAGAAAALSGSASTAQDAAADAATDPEAAAKALLAAGKYEDAEAAYRALLDQNAKNAAAWEGLGDSYAARSMKVEAASAYEKALQLNADNERLKDWMQKNVRY